MAASVVCIMRCEWLKYGATPTIGQWRLTNISRAPLDYDDFAMLNFCLARCAFGSVKEAARWDYFSICTQVLVSCTNVHVLSNGDSAHPPGENFNFPFF
jgi:hypothetical protein